MLIIVASLFCVLFGHGTHFHDLAVHIGEHFDVHVHVHAHESHDKPLHTDSAEGDNNHRHEVSKSSDIIGTLTSPIQVKTDIKINKVILLVSGYHHVDPKFDEIPILFDLPPPRSTEDQHHLSSYSHRGPPIS